MVLAAWLMAAPALGAIVDGASPPSLPDKTPWAMLGWAAGIAALALAVAFKSPRRTHLD